MLNITNSAAMARVLASPIDDHLRRLLTLRQQQLSGHGDLADLAHFVVAQGPDDTIAAIEAAAGYPIVTELSFEWVADHGDLFEAVTILSDDGFGIILFVPDSQGIDPELIALCREQATAPPPHAQGDDQEGQPHLP